jgi:hypothetical protein
MLARRRLLTLLIACAAVAVSAAGLQAPVGKVILSVTGKIAVFNAGDRADFDLAMIQALPQHRIETSTPWYHGVTRFTGPLMADLLAAVGARGTVLATVALNDYKVDIPVADLVTHGAILAWAHDDQPMPVRDKGPLFIVFPYDAAPVLQSERFFNRSPWQLRLIEVR